MTDTYPESKLAHKYCTGHGLEIGGAAHNPFGLNTLNVDMTDSMETIYKREEIKRCGRALPVDIVANGDAIPLPDGSQDFIVSSHVLEHFPNPIKALMEWDRLLRPGGVIFMIVPHKDRTFDKGNKRTPLQHLIDDYTNGNTEPHMNSTGHDHCWITEDGVELIQWMIKNLDIKWDIVEVQDTDDKAGNGFNIVIKKRQAMKILITAKYVSGEPSEGGSGRFLRCVADILSEMGHEVISSNRPEDHINKKYDLIICSHVLDIIKANPARKICISHGIIGDEHFMNGADRYISVSEEARAVNRLYGIDSEIIGQPIRMNGRSRPGKELKNILIIRREPVAPDPFTFLSEKYNVRMSLLDTPIEDQIDWADLCITLGRGALESMAQGKPVLIADNRHYIGAFGDGYVTRENICEIARFNFSGRRFRNPITREWIEIELAKYNPDDSDFLYDYILQNHEAGKIVRQYLEVIPNLKFSFGVLVNDLMRLDMVLRQSSINGKMHTIKMPDTATKGLNKLLGIMEGEGADIGILTHQDMFYRQGWIDQVKQQIGKLPDSWIVAGIVGKDMNGRICGRVHDMRIPLHFSTSHPFPYSEVSCFDECCIIVNLKKGFRFDERMPGFDLYGSFCVLQAKEMGGTAWIIDAFAEHYCMRSFEWYPDKAFENCFKWLHERFPDVKRIDSTVLGIPEEEEQKAA